MQRRIERRFVLAVAAVAALGIGCAGVPVHAASPYRGAPMGGLGGVIVGAIFGEQIAQHEAWHRAHDAPYDPYSSLDCHAGDACGCDAHHAWPDDDAHAWSDDEPADTWEDDYTREDAAGHDVPLPAQAELGVPEVLFDPGSATLTRGAEARLRHLARQVRERDDVELLLRGHSDEREQDGFELSEARARAVRAFLAEEGVSVRRIAWVGFGGAQPVASNETSAGRQRNRRVEIVLREPEPDPYS